jgi:hypothetical protein
MNGVNGAGMATITLMDEWPQNLRVSVSRARDHIENIRIRQGESVVVGHRNQQYPVFLWCAAEDGHAGWVPEEFLHMDSQREATALRDYDAAQLTVVKGELVEGLERAGVWIRCRNGAGTEGWVPETCLEPAA